MNPLKELTPRESGRFISGISKDVSVVETQIPYAAEKVFARMKAKKYSCATWKNWPLHPKEMNEDALNWIFVVDTLNFSFWLPTNQPQFQVEYKGVAYEDYEALCACLNRAIEEGIAITTPSFYRNITLDAVKRVFRSSNNTRLPMLEERVDNLRQTGKILCDQFQGSFAGVIEAAQQDVVKLIEMITRLFPCFNDVGVFEGQPVQFHKRVQILIADIWACFEGQSYGTFPNISELTMFPDYRVPQALLALKVITYSSSLMEKLKTEEILPYGGREEMEIRGCSVHAVELLRVAIGELLHEEKTHVNSVLIDFYLWDYATQHPDEMSAYPEHRTRSIFY